MQKFTPSFSDLCAFAVLVAAWVLAAWIVDPSGDFPLNDDWSYGLSAMFFSEEGRLVFSNWHSMTLLTQVLWGAAFCEALGASFEALRISTLVAGCMTILLAYWFLRRSGVGLLVAFIAASALALNPVFFSLED